MITTHHLTNNIFLLSLPQGADVFNIYNLLGKKLQAYSMIMLSLVSIQQLGMEKILMVITYLVDFISMSLMLAYILNKQKR